MYIFDCAFTTPLLLWELTGVKHYPLSLTQYSKIAAQLEREYYICWFLEVWWNITIYHKIEEEVMKEANAICFGKEGMTMNITTRDTIIRKTSQVRSRSCLSLLIMPRWDRVSFRRGTARQVFDAAGGCFRKKDVKDQDKLPLNNKTETITSSNSSSAMDVNYVGTSHSYKSRHSNSAQTETIPTASLASLLCFPGYLVCRLCISALPCANSRQTVHLSALLFGSPILSWPSHHRSRCHGHGGDEQLGIFRSSAISWPPAYMKKRVEIKQQKYNRQR